MNIKTFTERVYTLDEIPEKKQYIKSRLKKIYKETNESILSKILDEIKIIFRKQDEKGASNHRKRMIYVSFNELKKYGLDEKKNFIRYLKHPKSIITHETIHIFQNIFKDFPDVKYLFKDKNGKWRINYKDYISDKGEIQSRVEQIIELLNWGFEDSEIVEFLYSRKYNDQDLWKKLIEQAKKIRKLGSSKMPGIDDDENIDNEQGRIQNDKFNNYKGTGKNYEKDYLSS